MRRVLKIWNCLISWYWELSHDVTRIQTRKLLILLRFYFNDIQELIFIQFSPRMGPWSYAWISGFARRGIYLTAERAVMLVKKVTYFVEFGYLNNSCRKNIILMLLSSSSDKFTFLYHNSVRDVSVGFRPPCWSLFGWAYPSLTSPHKSL